MKGRTGDFTLSLPVKACWRILGTGRYFLNEFTMRFDDRFLDDIRARVNISDVVGRRVSWDRKKTQASKGDYWACCPFHEEKTPSFHADDRRGRYYCFGCGASGDIFRFLQETEALSFPESVERLAGEAGLSLPAQDGREQERAQRRSSLYEVMAQAWRFFQDALQQAEGAKARGYLRSRGLPFPLWEAFGIGYAPEGRNKLKQYLTGKGVSHEQMVDAGLLIAGPDIAVSYDRFRDRVMFPISDARGRVIAFGGRALSANTPAKYLNSPETELFSKSHILYNFHKAQKAVANGAQAVMVEGYLDVIAAAAHGLEGAVAPLGTALTQEQMLLLWRMSDEPVLCFDADAAGRRATNRAGDLALGLLRPGKTVRFALLPEGQDPDDVLQKGGQSLFERFLKTAKPLSDMIWLRETDGKVFDTPERRADLEARIQTLLRTIADSTLRRHYEQDFQERLALFFGIGAPSQKGALSRPGQKWTASIRRKAFLPSRSLEESPLVTDLSVKVSAKTYGPRSVLLLMTMINHPKLLDRHDEAFSKLNFKEEALARLHRAFICLMAERPDLSERAIRQELAQKGFEMLLQDLTRTLAECGLWQAGVEADDRHAEQGWLQALFLYERGETLAEELKAAEEALAHEATQANFVRLIEIQKQLASDEKAQALIEGFDPTLKQE